MVVINGSWLHTLEHMPATGKPLDLIPEWEIGETSGRHRLDAYRPPVIQREEFS
jgi:hypothetical protein